MKVEGTAPGGVDERLVDLTAGAGSEVRVGEDVGAAWKYRRLAVLITATDCFALLAAVGLAELIRFGPTAPHLEFLLVMALVPPVWIIVSAALHLQSVHRLAAIEEFRRLVSAVAVSITIVVIVSFWSNSSFSRLWIGLSLALSVLFLLIERRVWHSWIGKRRTAGKLSFRTLIVGTNAEAEKIAHVIGQDATGFEPVGFISTGNGTSGAAELPVYGHVPEIQDAIRWSGAECVFVASSAASVEQMRTIGKVVRREGVDMRVSANLPGTHSSRVMAQPIAGLMTLSLQPVTLTGFQAALKRTTDVALSLFALIIGAPVIAGVALAIKLTSQGPVLFRQERIGRRGQPFTLLKFRTMIVGAEAMIDELADRNEASGPLFKIRQDPRVYPLGKFLRKWSLDEFPQLLNVLKGDMSLVGPRPPLPNEVASYIESQFDRLEVRPGITGLWQVSGRSGLSFDDCVRLDLYYIENWSLSYDLFLLAKTIPAVLSGKGSY